MYKLYQSRKRIPWICSVMDNTPNLYITDDFFKFEEIPTNTLNFKTWNEGTIIVKSQDISYFKLENTITNEKRYWFVEKVDKVLKDGFQLKLRLDIYMTYTKKFLRSITYQQPIIERVYFNRKMFMWNKKLRRLIYYAFRLDDELLTNADYSFEGQELKTYDVARTKLPWKAKTDTITQANTNNKTHFNELDITYTTLDNDRYFFTHNLGMYIVMLRGQNGVYDFYPINAETFNLLPKWKDGNGPVWTQNGKTANDFRNLMLYIVNRKKADSLSGDLKDAVGVEGVKDIENIYQENSFQGIYRGPKLEDTQNFKVRLWANLSGSSLHLYGAYYFEMNPMQPKDARLFDIMQMKPNDSLIDYYINYSQPYIIGNNEVKPVRYTYFFGDQPEQEYGVIPISVLFNCGFVGESIAIPIPTEFSSPDDIISYGRDIPSPTADYANQIRKIQQTYDTGLTNAAIGAIQGIPSALGKSAASGWWGISSVIGSGLTWARDLKNLSMNRRNSLANMNATYMNSSNVGWYNFTNYYELFRGTDLTTSKQSAPNQLSLKEPYIIKKFTEEQKEQIKFIIENYGYKLNTALPFTEWVEQLQQTDIAFIQFNSEWLNTYIPQIIDDETWNKDIQDSIIEQLSNGIRMHMEWK